MRISKLCLVVCAVISCAFIPTLRADDTPAQAAARAALEQQMQTLDAQEASKNAQSSAPAAPAQTATAAAATQAPAATNAQQTQPPPVAVTPAGAQSNNPAAAPATAAAVHPGSSLFAPVPPPSGGVPASAISGQTTQPSTSPVAATTSLPMAPAQKKNSAAIPAQELGLKPIVAPPLPISSEQQAQLQALLAKYEAGAISPVEYQVERKKILNLPQ